MKVELLSFLLQSGRVPRFANSGVICFSCKSEMKTASITIGELRELAVDFGLDIVGACDITKLKDEIPRLKEWQNAGHAGEMKYMMRDAELLTGISHILPGARSVISCTLAYSSDPHPPLLPGFGRVARYAWGKDYHLVLPELLKKLVSAAEKKLGRPISARVMTDALPFLERAGARLAGLGFIGKNTMLIRKGVGSFFFISEIFWDLEIEAADAPEQANDCGTCQRCLEQCPTNAFTAPYQLNAPRCISYLTIEKRGAHSEDERRSLGEWLFGCDICQEVCPFNHAAIKHPSLKVVEPFRHGSGNGALLNLREILTLPSNKAFKEKFAASPLLRPGRAGLQRNALAVAVNTNCVELENEIFELAEHSPSDVVRKTALWALGKFARRNELRDHNRLTRINK